MFLYRLFPAATDEINELQFWYLHHGLILHGAAFMTEVLQSLLLEVFLLTGRCLYTQKTQLCLLL